MPRETRKRSRTSRSRSRRSSTIRGSSRKRIAYVKKPLALKTHNFVERTEPQLLRVASEGAAVGMFRDFTWNQCLQVGNYANIFEYYKINKVVVEFRYKGATKPAYTTINGTGSTNNEIVNEVNPVLYFKVDHNDINADTLATMKNSLRTHEKQLTNDKPNFSITLKPAIQAEAYKTAISTAYRPKWNQWLSTLDATVPHYGLKAYAVAGNAASSVNMGEIEVTTKIYFSCKCNE